MELEASHESIDHLKNALKTTRIVMFTTIDEDESLQSRPMAVQDVEFEGDLWFFTSNESGKVYQLKEHSQVNAAFIDTKNNTYVSASGTAQLVNDEAKKQELWSPALEIYFPKGIDDPELTLIRVSVTSIAWWAGASTIIGQVVSFVKAWTKKDPSEMGESGASQIA